MQEPGKFLRLAEQYVSIQGEGKHMGQLCAFVRTGGCDLRCVWCDTPDALTGGQWKSEEEILRTIPSSIALVQITGGEPLIQKSNVIRLMDSLHSRGQKSLLETGGHKSLEGIPTHCHIVMDIKLGDSGENHHDFATNFPHLKRTDEIKFVIASEKDYREALIWIQNHKLNELCDLLFSPVWEKLDLKLLSEWMIRDNPPARLQTQLHKWIWGGNTKSV